jgi:AcrR family transcriptional regulator
MTMTDTAARAATPRYRAKKDRIVAVATAILNETGVDGFTLARVAEAVGCHPATLGYYWRKDTLIETCVMEAAERIRAMADAALDAETPAGHVEAFVRAYFDERRRIWLGEASDYADFSELRQSGPQAFEAYQAMFRAIARLFRGAPTAADTRAGAPWARLAIELIGWSRSWLRPTEAADFDRAADAMTTFLGSGLAAEGVAWPPIPPAEAQAPAPHPSVAPREAFLVAATRIMNQTGYRGASVERISASLGRTKGAFYHHHADKGEVIEACFARTFQIMNDALAAAAEAPTGWSRVATAAATLATRHSSLQSLMVRTYALASLPPRLRWTMTDRFGETAAGFRRFIEEGVADGSIRPIDPEAASQMVLTLVNSSAYLNAWAPQIEPADVGDAYVRPTLMGLLRAE